MAGAGSGTAAKVAARWEPVTHFTGTGNQRTPPFQIVPNAIHWRVTASCDAGTLHVVVLGEPKPLFDSACPGKGFGFSIHTGPTELDVAATGDWELTVDQQVDTPVSEPALAGMSDRSRLASGDFFGIDQEGAGAVALYKLTNGRLALRFDPFEVSANTDLFVWVSEADAPRSSKEALLSPHVQIDPLTATAGPQNYLVPEGMPPERIRSVVIWCEPVRTAYAAAALARR